MSMPAFYLEAQKWTPHPVLTGDEASHARVLRLQAGEKVLLLNGQGTTATCQIKNLDKKSMSLEILEQTFTGPPNARAIMALALSKAVRRDFFMEKAAELGAWAIWIWQAERSQGKIESFVGKNTAARLIAGMKQSHNPWLPALRIFSGAEKMLAETAAVNWKVLPWEAQCGVPMITDSQLGRAGDTVYVIGPEGGFSPKELDLLKQNGFTGVSFGKRILRCETAATLCLGLHWWASQLPGHPDCHGDSA